MAVPSSPAAAAPTAEKNNNEETNKKSGTHKEDTQKQPKRTKSPGLRVVHGRIYDSQNGKTCHQCRQKTMDFTAACKNMKGNKQCTIKFCHKCLLNRYGENAEEMEARGDWNCPKCRDICNCSFCMKKKGHKPTGVLVHAAKATGFTSVSEFLHVKGPDVCMELIDKSKTDIPKNSAALTEVPALGSPKKRGKENSFDGACNTNLNSCSPPLSPNCNKKKRVKREEGVVELEEKVEITTSKFVCSPRKGTEEIALRRSPRKFNIPQEVTKKEEAYDDKGNIRRSPRKFNAPLEVTKTDEKDAKKCEKETKNVKNAKVQGEPKVKQHKPKKDTDIDQIAVNISLPPGSMLSNIVGIDLLPCDAGYVLQFLEFCSVFGEVLNIKKGQPESVLRDILNSRTRRKGKFSSVVQFTIQLVSFILEDIEEEVEEDEDESLSSNPSEGNDSWIKSLKRCLEESDLELEDFPENFLDKGSYGYEMLEPSQKLRLLTFLCDESLSTQKMRTKIDEHKSKFVEIDKESLNAAREKEKQAQKKLQEELAKAIIAKNGVPLTIAEHDSMITMIKKETDRARAELLGVPKKRLRSDAVRTDPVYVDDNGHAFWKLKCYDDSVFLLQEIGGPDQVDYKDNWFCFSDEEMKLVEAYVSTSRLNRSKRIKLADKANPKGNSDSEVDSSSNDDSQPHC